MRNSMHKVLIESNPAVRELDYEGKEDGYWCYLKDGYVDTESGCTVIHEWTLKDVWNKLDYVREEVTK